MPAQPGDRSILWVVATPIGNIDDLSPRAREVLGNVTTLLCEDTRRTRSLLTALSLSGQLERCDAHAPDAAFDRWIERLEGGDSFALVSDAGTPGVSDPGAKLIRRARERGIRVVPIPGPSAPITLYSVSGWSETSFSFRGFFPRKGSERAEELTRFQQSEQGGAWIYFESPHRIEEALELIAATLPEIRVIAGKEFTKIHEKTFEGISPEVFIQVSSELKQEGIVGEWCFAILDPQPKAKESRIPGDAWVKSLEILLDCEVSPSKAAKKVGHYFGIARNTAYAKALELSSAKKDSQGA